MAQKNSRLMSPILFASPTTSVVAGRSALADTGALSTKFRRPFWIDEIRLSSYFITNTIVATNSYAMQARFKLGPYALSDRYIPFPNYAPFLNIYNENFDSFGGPDGYVAWYRWKLPKPLFVPAGMTLVCDFFRPLGKTPATASADVAYAGRYLRGKEPTPAEVDVPWVTMFDPATDAVFAQSSELDLYNPFQVPLSVQRLLAANQDATGFTATVNTNQVTVMKDSAGSNVIRDFTETGSVFDLNRRAWTVNRVLAPRERYNITLQALTGDLNNYHVSLVGSRKERL